MRIADMNWMQVARSRREGRPRACCRSARPSSTRYLSLCVDAILSERVAVEAAEPLGFRCFPVITYGLTPSFVDYPGTVTLRHLDAVRAGRATCSTASSAPASGAS